MRYLGWILILLVITTLCGCGGSGKDPIIGKWQAAGSATAPVTMEFKADGTTALQIDIEKALAEMEKKQPGSSAMMRPMLEQSVKMMKDAKITWKKEGTIYCMTSTMNGKSEAPAYMKIENDKIVGCDKSGKTTTGQPALVRVK